MKKSSTGFSKGYIPWNKGIKWRKKNNNQIPWNRGLSKENSETILKQGKEHSKRMKGTHPITEYKKGDKRLIGHKFNIGKIPWNKGKNLSKEYRDKISESKKGSIPWNKGIPVSPKEKLRLKQMRAKQIFPKKDTKIEVKIRNFLDELQIEYFQHKYMNIKNAYQCDFFIPSLNLVIECDGIYWHKYPTGRDIDHIRTKQLIQNGFKVLRLWEFEINDMTLNEFKGKLNE